MCCRQRQSGAHISVEGLAVRNRRTQGVVQVGTYVGLIDGLLEILAASHIYRCGKAGIGTSLGVFGMRPLEVVNVLLGIIGIASFAVDQVFESKIQISAILVSFGIRAFKTHSITPVGVIIPQNRQVVIVAQRKIITSILQRKSPGVRIVVTR